MKLSKYMKILEEMTRIYRTEGQLEDAALDIQPSDFGMIRQDYEWAIKALHESVRNNKHLLGIFQAGQGTAPSPEEVKEAEISQSDLRLHIAHVRFDLKALIATAPKVHQNKIGEIAVRLLQELTSRANVTDLGQVFSNEEAAFVKTHCQEESVAAPADNRDDEESQIDLEALMIRLREEGKIL
ncbi:hypothetical protein KJ657_04490 [Patescibacteria group bacterium]|nr:hypothetical protein [Patescibacteria group bacterium]MBU1016313.1 hypothetical protein [Patescibacteria group bacterium]MBU1685589.1 hypothetical protein [Patescibacteria group bacterium]MBU1938514.1 hypothetical protein [Patescibacteria group bacterium]